MAASESGRRHVKSEELVMQSMFLNSFRDHATMEGRRAHGEREEPDADQAGFWKKCRRMKEGKNRMQIRPDFGKDAGAWRKRRTGCRSGRILEKMPAHEEKEDKKGS